MYAPRQSGRKKRPPAHLSADMDWEEVPEAIRVGTAARPKVLLPEPEVMQKGGRTLKGIRVPNPVTRTGNFGHYLPREQTPGILPEVNLTNAEVGQSIAGSSRFAMEWLHEAADRTVEAYTCQTVSEESSAVKTDHGFGAGRIIEDKTRPSTVHLPTIDGIVTPSISSSYYKDLGAENRPKSTTVMRAPELPGQGVKRKKKGSKKSKKMMALERVASSSSSQTSSDTESLPREIIPVDEFIDRTTNRIRERLASYIHEASIGSNFELLNDYNKLQKIRQSNAALKAKVDKTKRVSLLVDNILGALPTDEELDDFEHDLARHKTECQQKVKKKPGRPPGPSKLPYGYAKALAAKQKAEKAAAAAAQQATSAQTSPGKSHVEDYIHM